MKKCNDYHSFECKVLMKNGPRKPLKCETLITGETTFAKIIEDLNSHPLISGEDIEFLN
jgi:hypothetical protein